MKSRSFRFQIVLWSVLISGAVLLSFGVVAWWSLNHDRITALDESLTTFGFRHATRASPGADMERMELSMLENFGGERAVTRFFAFLTQDGREIHRSANWPPILDPSSFAASTTLLDPQPTLPKPPPREDRGEPEHRSRPVFTPLFHPAAANGHRYRIGAFANREVRIIVGADLLELSGEVDSLRRAFLLALPGALLLIGFGAWLIARRALRSVDAIGNDMKRISVQALDSRLETGKADLEFAAIIGQYNAMLERLERSFHQATRFSADASHELKTPLAVMRGTLERALAHSGDDPQAQAVYSDLLEQTDRQKGIIECLLILSRADSGQLHLSAGRVDLSSQLHLWLEDAGYLAEERGITIRSEVDPDLFVSGDLNLLQQVAHNLFSNAVRYNRDRGEIECVLKRVGDELEWSVASTGETIQPADRDRIFNRFERAQSAGDHGADGMGLGLSLVREILQAHGGRIILEDDTGDGWNRFRVTLPAA